MTTPSGWYDDGHGAVRWWDGARWTEHIAQPGADAHGLAAPGATPGAAEPHAATGEAPATVLTAPMGPAAPAPPPRPTTSKLWIVWVVLGVVLLTVVILGALLIPRLIVAASGQSAPSTGGATTDADQDAAVAAVELYDDAWQNADCDAYFASTTESFRTQSGLADCSAFETEAEAFTAGVEDYEVDVTDVRGEGDDIHVATTESYKALVGEDGAPLDDPAEDSIDWLYVLVSDGDEWLIDDMR